jgi:release factor glutamine methyltransferase
VDSPKNVSVIWRTMVRKLRAAGCVYAEDEARLLISSARNYSELIKMADRRAAGYPLEHIIGWTEFCGVRIELDTGVFVPRPKSEFLVRQAAALTQPGDVVVDLCCGSGALGAALVTGMERFELHAVDIDPIAVQCARRNIHVDMGYVYEGDLYDPLPLHLHNRVHVIIANAPYVPAKAIKLLPSEARVHEARIALDGGADGLDIQRRIAAEAPLWLVQGGFLLVETSELQAPSTAELFAQNGLLPQWVHSDELEANIIIGTRTV